MYSAYTLIYWESFRVAHRASEDCNRAEQKIVDNLLQKSLSIHSTRVGLRQRYKIKTMERFLFTKCAKSKASTNKWQGKL